MSVSVSLSRAAAGSISRTGGLAVLIVALVLGAVPATAAPAPDPRIVNPWSEAGPQRTLRDGSPARAGLVASHLRGLRAAAAAGIDAEPRPRYAGAVALAARRGVVVHHSAHGDALRYADAEGTLLPRGERIRMRRNTRFDLASISKLFTTVAVLQLVEDGAIRLDEPVATYLPAFGQAGKGDVTVRQLLTHTSGLPAWAPLYAVDGDRDDRLAELYETPLNTAPGDAYVYSDLGQITLGEIVTARSGQALDRYVARHITRPLGMRRTGYNPAARLQRQTAATEFQPFVDRGLVHGEVHDENAWSLGGVAGHAGVFSTASDLAVFAQMLLNGGRYGGARILRRDTIALAMTDQISELGGGRGLGFELGQHWYMGALATPWTAGHTGFTGTSLVIDPTSDTFVILLTNRVHPSREWGSNNVDREAVANVVGRAVPVRTGGRAWFSGVANDVERTLRASLPAGSSRLRAGLWVDTEPDADVLEVQASTDRGATWRAVATTLRLGPRRLEAAGGVVSGWYARRWMRATLLLPRGATDVRLTYRTDASGAGRGVYLRDAEVRTRRGVRPLRPSAWEPDGWKLVGN